MNVGRPQDPDLALSVVIPSYNSAEWLPSTLAALAGAIERCGRSVEVIVVDDGSIDDTSDVVAAVAREFPGHVELLTQPNRGRFMARWAGLTRAAADLVLLLDSRVIIHDDALSHVLDAMGDELDPPAWNGHIVTDPRAPLIGLFWEVPTHVFWGRYLRSPRPMDLTEDNFDHAPKGTTMFLARKDVLVDAFKRAWPDGDARLVSDDTKVLRRIARTGKIRLDPSFSATYRPRTTVRGFAKHTYDRGTLFVDSYAGTTTAHSVLLLLLVIAPILFVAILLVLLVAGYPRTAAALVLGTVAFVLLPAAIAAVNRCPARSVRAYIAYLPVFVVPFWLGLVRGVVLHRRSFMQSPHPREGVAPGTELR